MKLFFKLFCLVAVVAATAALVKGDGEGKECSAAIEADLEFSQMYNTADATISNLWFSQKNEYEVQGSFFFFPCFLFFVFFLFHSYVKFFFCFPACFRYLVPYQG